LLQDEITTGIENHDLLTELSNPSMSVTY